MDSCMLTLYNLVQLGSGPRPGWRYQVEAYSILAATQFLAYYISCYDVPLPGTTIKCHCNNSGDITTLCNMQMERNPRPNDTTNNDQDIFMEIQVMAAQTKAIHYEYYHMKGHQDKDPEHKLTLAEQYNVNCNHYTKEYVQSTNLCSTHINNPAFAAAQPHLMIEGKVICCRFLPSLCAAAFTPHTGSTWKRDYHGCTLRLTRYSGRYCPWLLTPSPVKINDGLYCSYTINYRFKPPSFTHTRDQSYAHPVSDTLKISATFWNAITQREVAYLRNYDSNLLQYWWSLPSTQASSQLFGLVGDQKWHPLSKHCFGSTPKLRQMVHHQSRLGWHQLYYGRLSKLWATAIDAINPNLFLSGHQTIT